MSNLRSVMLFCGILSQAVTVLADIRANEDENVMSPEFVGVARDQLPAPTSSGAALYQQYCGQCHHMVAPSKFDRAHWQLTLERMRDRIKSQGKTLPSDQDWAEIAQYIYQYSAQ